MSDIPDPDTPGLAVIDGRAWPLLADARYEFTGQQLAGLLEEAANNEPGLSNQAWGVELSPTWARAHVEPGERALANRAIIGYFTSEMPETVKIANLGAIMDWIEENVVVNWPDRSDAVANEELVRSYELAVDDLLAIDVLQKSEHLGEIVYGLTVAAQKRILDQVVGFLDNRVGAEKVRAERGDISWHDAGDRREHLRAAATILRMPMEPGK